MSLISSLEIKSIKIQKILFNPNVNGKVVESLFKGRRINIEILKITRNNKTLIRDVFFRTFLIFTLRTSK